MVLFAPLLCGECYRWGGISDRERFLMGLGGWGGWMDGWMDLPLAVFVCVKAMMGIPCGRLYGVRVNSPSCVGPWTRPWWDRSGMLYCFPELCAALWTTTCACPLPSTRAFLSGRILPLGGFPVRILYGVVDLLFVFLNSIKYTINSLLPQFLKPPSSGFASQFSLPPGFLLPSLRFSRDVSSLLFN